MGLREVLVAVDDSLFASVPFHIKFWVITSLSIVALIMTAIIGFFSQAHNYAFLNYISLSIFTAWLIVATAHSRGKSSDTVAQKLRKYIFVALATAAEVLISVNLWAPALAYAVWGAELVLAALALAWMIDNMKWAITTGRWRDPYEREKKEPTVTCVLKCPSLQALAQAPEAEITVA